MVLGVKHLRSVETFRGHSPGPVQTNEVWQIFSENAQQAGAEADGEWFQATRGGLMGIGAAYSLLVGFLLDHEG